ncbi:MAG: hypothetical protein N4A49_07180 [Marinifilaceae bacterium]|jgi:hypothetical protein|nr:hypothetical protein [Marinifilaceae bacterium]
MQELQEFKYIRNRIREYSKFDLLSACYNKLEKDKDKITPIWSIFLLMKWTYLYGGSKYPSKQLDDSRFVKLLNQVYKLNEEHISRFIKNGGINRMFQIIYSQQIYLQKNVYNEIFSTQLKLFTSLKHKYDIEGKFIETTGLSISDFILIHYIVFIYTSIDKIPVSNLTYTGYLEEDLLDVISEFSTKEKVKRYINLLILNPFNPEDDINNFRLRLKNNSLQPMEMSFFTQFPFQIFNNRIKIIHQSIFNYSCNYYLYDYLKTIDPNFTTEFGNRFEKYVELGLKEINLNYYNEKQLKNKLDAKSNLVDFYIESENIYIECKAIELQSYSLVNPTDEILFNSLKDSIIKAYFKQLVSVSSRLGKDTETNYGIILTYKELLFGDFKELYKIGKPYFQDLDCNHLPPENVFIIDINTWDHIIAIIKNKKASLLSILEKAKRNNMNLDTKKMSFVEQLNEYDVKVFNLSYLERENDVTAIDKKTSNNGS